MEDGKGHERESAMLAVSMGDDLFRRFFSPQAAEALREMGSLSFFRPDGPPSRKQWEEVLKDVRVLLTSWYTPPLPPNLRALAPQLGLIAHTAGTVRPFLGVEVLREGIRVVHAAHAMVGPVAEFTLMLLLRALRPGLAQGNRGWEGEEAWGWRDAQLGHELAGCPVGVVGAGQIGRRVIRLLRAFEAEVCVYDPFLSDRESSELGVSRAGLLELMGRGKMVTLHAPALVSTRHMIGQAELASMPDGAWLINTARSSLVDGQALWAQLRSGRISAALDVFDEEPLPPDSPFRGLPNVLLTPHAAFKTWECFRRFGDDTVEEVRRFLTGQGLLHEITLDRWERMA